MKKLLKVLIVLTLLFLLAAIWSLTDERYALFLSCAWPVLIVLIPIIAEKMAEIYYEV